MESTPKYHDSIQLVDRHIAPALLHFTVNTDLCHILSPSQRQLRPVG